MIVLASRLWILVASLVAATCHSPWDGCRDSRGTALGRLDRAKFPSKSAFGTGGTGLAGKVGGMPIFLLHVFAKNQPEPIRAKPKQTEQTGQAQQADPNAIYHHLT